MFDTNTLFLIGAGILGIFGGGGLMYIINKLFNKAPDIDINSPDNLREEVDELSKDIESDTKEAESIVEICQKIVEESDAREEDIKEDCEEKVSALKKGNVSKVKDYLESEGYNVNEIYPED